MLIWQFIVLFPCENLTTNNFASFLLPCSDHKKNNLLQFVWCKTNWEKCICWLCHVSTMTFALDSAQDRKYVPLTFCDKTDKSQIYLRFIKFIPRWPVTTSPKYQIIWIIWFLIGYLRQLFSKLNYGNLKNLWKKKNTYIWKSFFIPATLGPLSRYHNLILKTVTTFP